MSHLCLGSAWCYLLFLDQFTQEWLHQLYTQKMPQTVCEWVFGCPASRSACIFGSSVCDAWNIVGKHWLKQNSRESSSWSKTPGYQLETLNLPFPIFSVHVIWIKLSSFDRFWIKAWTTRNPQHATEVQDHEGSQVENRHFQFSITLKSLEHV